MNQYMTIQSNDNFISLSDGDKKHKPINFGDSLINFMLQDTVNKIDSRKLKGIDNSKDKIISEIVNNSDFVSERTKWGKKIAGMGMTCIAMVYIDGKWRFQFFQPIHYEKYFNVIHKLVVNGVGDKYNHKGKQLDVNFMWNTLDDGTVVRESVVNTGNESHPKWITVNKDKTYTYPSYVTQVPATLIRNNAEAAPDHFFVMDILKELNTMSNDLGNEWEMIKTQYQNFGIQGRGESGKQKVKKIQNGESIHDTWSINSKFASEFQMLISGSQTTQILITQMVFLEDRALKYAFQGREMDASGTNKHNTQIGLFHQANSEYINCKREQRERDWSYFFNVIVPMVTNNKSLNVPKNVKFDTTIYEKGKEDGMKATRFNNNQQAAAAKQQNANAEKAKVETKMIESDERKENKNEE